MLIDTHAHLSYPQLACERDAVIQRSVEAGVTRIVDVGTNAVTSRSAVETAGSHAEVFASVGFHPHDAMGANESGLATIRSSLQEDRVVAVGETGLDFFRTMRLTIFKSGCSDRTFKWLLIQGCP